MRQQNSTDLTRLIIAILLPFIAFALQTIFWGAIKPYVWFMFFPAVFFSSWVAGLSGGIAATIISTAMVWWAFIPPEGSFALQNNSSLWSIIVFVVMGILFGYSQESIKKANQKKIEALETAQTANDRLRDANIKITQLYEKTREIDQLKTQLFANVSHELRTPLTLILGPVRKRLASGQISSEEKKYLQVVERNARLLYRHVSDLLDVAKLDAGRMTMHYTQVDLARLVRVIASYFELLSSENHIDFQVDTPESLTAQVDGEKCQRILLNILSNAFKFTPAGGRISLSLQVQEEGAILQVRDNGPGIPTDKRQLIFERFGQITQNPNRRSGGTGLGLAIVKDFIRLQHGSVDVDESPGGGAQFTIWLPLTPPVGTEIDQTPADIDEEIGRQILDELRLHPDETPAVLPDDKPRSALVLVVEDNPDMNAFLVENLSPLYRLATAFDGEEGLDLAQKIHPDLIVSDVMMPKMSGDQMAQAIRSHPQTADVPIIFLSARADDAFRLEQLKGGVQEYIYKPFSVEELLTRVDRLISEKAQKEAAVRDAYELLHAVIESIPDVIFVKDTQGRYLMINTAGAQVLKIPVEQILGKRDDELFPSIEGQKLIAEDRTILANKMGQTAEIALALPGGTRHFLSTKAPYYDSEGETAGVLGISRDITEQKIAAERIKKLNRVLSVLSEINQVIVRIRDQERLFTTVCHIAVEIGGFQLAWIGLADKKSQIVQKIASAGNAEGFLDRFPFTLADLQQSYCPIIATLRDGEHNLCNNLSQVKDLAECQRAALNLGFRSSASFPLQVHGEILGTIILYADEPDFFDEEELTLLDEMAMDVSFAMEFEVTESQRKKSENALEKRESLLTQMGRTAKVGAWELDVGRSVLVWTEELFRIHEVDPSFEPSVDRAIDFYAPSSRTIMERLLRRAIEFGEPYDAELEFVTAKGNHRYVHTIGSAIQENGKTTKISGILQDITERKHAEETLRQSEARFRSLFENMLNGFAYCRMLYEEGEPLDFVYLNVNAAFERLTGLQDVTEKKVSEVIPGIQDTDPGLLEIYSRVALSGVPETFEFFLAAMQMWFSVSVYSPEKGYFVAVFDVISERKRIELALRESEERYRLIVETLTLGIAIHVDNKIIYGNAAALRLIGGTNIEDLLGKPVMAFVHPEDRPLIMGLVQAAFSREPGSLPSEQNIVEERLLRLDGSIITIEASAVLINYYGKPALLVMMNDISERKHAVTALKNSEERLRAFFMSGVFGASYGDVYGKIKTANDEFLRILGYSREELDAGKISWLDFTPKEYLELDEIAIAQAKRDGVCTPFEKEYIRKDGSRVWVLVGFVLVGQVRDDSIAFVLDLTNLKIKEEEIKKLNTELELRVKQRTQQLESVNKELEAFSYSVSHDLRAPLRAIEGFSRIISEDYADKLDSDGNHLLDGIRANTTKMDRLITDLLALSRMTSAEMNHTRIDMAELARLIFAEITTPELRDKFSFSVANIPEVYGDPIQIRQVWTNLLANAIKYTLPKGERRIDVGGYREKEMAVYWVKDTGVGFDQHYVHRLFGVFQRLHRAEDFEGTGVGLAIVQRIVDRHGGKVWAEGIVDQGATFYFSLPIQGMHIV